MDTQIEVEYLGELRTKAKHLKSKDELITDAPIDNKGLGRAFAPTDLLAASVASCMITTMGIIAEGLEVDIEGVRASVKKVMSSKPRKVSELHVDISFATDIPNEHKQALELSAKNCPVARSLDPNIKKFTAFNYKRS